MVILEGFIETYVQIWLKLQFARCVCLYRVAFDSVAVVQCWVNVTELDLAPGHECVASKWTKINFSLWTVTGPVSRSEITQKP